MLWVMNQIESNRLKSAPAVEEVSLLVVIYVPEEHNSGCTLPREFVRYAAEVNAQIDISAAYWPREDQEAAEANP